MRNTVLQLLQFLLHIALQNTFYPVTSLVGFKNYAPHSGYSLLHQLQFVTPCYGCYTTATVTITNTFKKAWLHIVTGVTYRYTMLRLLQMLHPRHLILIINRILYLKGLLLSIFYEDKYSMNT